MKFQHLLLALLALGSLSSAYAANRPKNYVTICKEAATCSVSSSTQVAFGRADQFLYKQLNGSFVCSEATFGGRVAGGVNECSVPVSSAASSAQTSSAASSTQSSSQTSAASSTASSSAAYSANSSATANMLNLANYQLAGSYSLPSKAAEASAVTWNWDSNTLFVLGDEGKAIVQINKQGQQIDVMSLSGFADTEALTYIGNGQFVIAEERLQDAYLLTYSAGSTVARSSLKSLSIDSTVDNIGIEGIGYDRIAGDYIAVKEKSPQAVYKLTLNFAGNSIGKSTQFAASTLGLTDLSDVQPLSSVSKLPEAARTAMLILSQESAKLLEVTRSGSVLSSLGISSISTDVEGVTIDADGIIYLVSQAPKLYVLKPR